MFRVVNDLVLCSSICPQIQALRPSLLNSILKTVRTPQQQLRPPCPPQLTTYRRCHQNLRFLTCLQTVHVQTGAAPTPGLTFRGAAREARRKRRRRRRRRLRKPKTTRSIFTVRLAKWQSIQAPSWSLTVVVRTFAAVTSVHFSTVLMFHSSVWSDDSGSKHKQMLDGQSSSRPHGRARMGSSPRPKGRMKQRIRSKSRVVVGVTNLAFHCELCQVSVNSETQLKQVCVLYCLL